MCFTDGVIARVILEEERSSCTRCSKMVHFIFKNLFRVITLSCSKNPTLKKNVNDKFILYGDEISPPVRYVQMVASMLQIKLDYHNIALFKEDNKSPFYKKINPLQKVPALQVGDDVICDSHAIAMYLCQIKNDQNLYPEDCITRAKVTQTMFFNAGTLFPIDSFIFTEYFRGKWPASKVKIQEWYSAVDHLEHLLSHHKWLACDKMTLADLCCVTTVSSMQLLVPLLDRHEEVGQWLEKIEKVPCYEINSRGLKKFKSCIQCL